jgi:hypothetical protein
MAGACGDSTCNQDREAKMVVAAPGAHAVELDKARDGHA